MAEFKHYIITCLNVGVFSHRGGMVGTIPVEDWMRQRMQLFVTFTLPSVMSQTCRNFVWLLLLDEKTPADYRRLIEAVPFENLRIVYTDSKSFDNSYVASEVIKNIEPGDYDLMTTEVDSDDAIHKNMVAAIQSNYQHDDRMQQYIFPEGLIYDLYSGELFPMDYMYHCPTIVERSIDAKSVYHWHNSKIPAEKRDAYYDVRFWLQVIHSNNVANRMESDLTKNIHREAPLGVDVLKEFGVNIQNLAKYHRL
jgi:hypothetical protein